MIFNSVTYLVFLGISVALYWALPTRPRQWMLFVASLTFYGFWRPEFLILMIASASADFIAARRIQALEASRQRLGWLLLSLGINLGLLLYFKYLFFVLDNARTILDVFGTQVSLPALDIVLPLGISFYTFQTISYTVDVYRRHTPAERDFLAYGCFVTFFPQLVAGPILRASELLGQLAHRPKFRSEDMRIGLQRILDGLFLKVVLADNISPLVDAGFAQPASSLSALDVWTLAFMFGYQIYFDFSAYSHIALGSARLMGIHFPENFNFPYAATSPRDFWRRWHISLSSWIRDYLYLPLLHARPQIHSVGGLAVAGSDFIKAQRRTIALFATWAIMGLWHGANWTFIVWGVYHAALIAGYRVIEPAVAGLSEVSRRLGGWFVTLPLVMLGWIPFRAQSLADVATLFGKLISASSYTWLGMRENIYLIAALILAGLIGSHMLHHTSKWRGDSLAFAPLIAMTAWRGLQTFLVIVFLRPISQFIYFQF